MTTLPATYAAERAATVEAPPAPPPLPEVEELARLDARAVELDAQIAADRAKVAELEQQIGAAERDPGGVKDWSRPAAWAARAKALRAQVERLADERRRLEPEIGEASHRAATRERQLSEARATLAAVADLFSDRRPMDIYSPPVTEDTLRRRPQAAGRVLYGMAARAAAVLRAAGEAVPDRLTLTLDLREESAPE